MIVIELLVIIDFKPETNYEKTTSDSPFSA